MRFKQVCHKLLAINNFKYAFEQDTKEAYKFPSFRGKYFKMKSGAIAKELFFQMAQENNFNPREI